MKTNYFFYFLLSLSFVYLNNTLAQGIAVYNMIGKPQKDVIAIYGTPAHLDNSSSSMICMFYKMPSMVFVADEMGVYQAEITKEYSSDKEMRDELTASIQKAIKVGFKIDSLSVNNFVFEKSGVRAETELKNLTETQKFQLKILAKRHDF